MKDWAVLIGTCFVVLGGWFGFVCGVVFITGLQPFWTAVITANVIVVVGVVFAKLISDLVRDLYI